MGLVLESQEEKLRVTGLPAGFSESCDGLRDLHVDFLVVATPEGIVINQGGLDAIVSLSNEWCAKVAEGYQPRQQIVLDLEIAKPQTEDEKALHAILVGEGRNVYEIKDMWYEPSPMAAYQ